MWCWLFCLAALAVLNVEGAGAGAARLVCYAGNSRAFDSFTGCTHLVYAGDARGDKLDALLKDYRKNSPRLKIIVRVAEADKDIRSLLKSKHIQGLEIHDAHRSLNKTNVLETVETARQAISSSGGGPLFLALPAHPELLAKYYDLRALVKVVDLMMVQTHALGQVKKMTYHPSRLSGLWDMMNTDSVVDLVVGLGVPSSKLVVSLPATARQFTLQNETLSTPGSPTEEDEPKEIDQAELCRLLQKGRWTLERDQDLSAPYAFKDKTWISFEDASSIDVKGKYARVRGLAGLALQDADRDLDTPCGPTLKASLAKVLNQQSRAPRAAVLRSLENEILSAPLQARAVDALQVSPYRITQVVDSDGVIHSIREDTRTEFSCSRQGYFVHPRSCARFYRCVKFDQLSPEYTVFEFDCPTGLAFDARYEVCVWPGSLPDSQACPGSSEIAPVPRTRFICPEHEGYYADPENCRWFFACLDHGKAPLSAYEFRCPFGLGFDAARLTCDWPWLVPACGNIARYEAEAHGFSAAILTGAAGFHGQTADAVNVAAHNSLVSGASLNNLVGIQNGFLTKDDALDSNFIASQELANAQNQAFNIAHSQNNLGASGLAFQVGEVSAIGSGPVGLVQATKYNDQEKYTSGSLILDEYRLPTKTAHSAVNLNQNAQYYNGNGYAASSFSSGQKAQYQSANYEDNSGQYVHDPSGDYAEPYKHVGSPVVPYTHDDSGYKQAGGYSDSGSYSYSSYENNYAGNNGRYEHDNSGAYVASQSDSGAYKGEGTYNADYSGTYVDNNSGNYEAGVYRAGGHIGTKASGVGVNQYNGGYSTANTGYVYQPHVYTGSSHTLTAGAVNVGLVGKTTLVDTGYTNQNNYQAHTGYSTATKAQSYNNQVVHQAQHAGHVSLVSQPAVSINHVGTDAHNLDGYSYVTTPTTSAIPTTVTPFLTTSLPAVTYKTTFLPEAPKTSIKQVFGVSQPAVTYVQSTVVPLKHSFVPEVQYVDTQKVNYQYNNNNYAYNSASSAKSGGYEYSKPAIKFEDGISYSTAAPVVSTQNAGEYNHQTVHNVEAVGFGYSTPAPVNVPVKKLVVTPGPTVSYFQPSVSTYTPQAVSHQTIHKVETPKVYTPVVASTPAPIAITTALPVVTTYKTTFIPEPPKTSIKQVFGYTQPAVTYVQPAVVKQQIPVYSYNSQNNDYLSVNAAVSSHSESGYQYQKPSVTFEDGVQYSTPPPVVSVSTFKPQGFSHSQNTLHKVESVGFDYSTAVPVTEEPIRKAVAYTTGPSVTNFVQPTISTPVAFSHQTLHNVQADKVQVGAGYEYNNAAVAFEEPKIVQYTTLQPTVSTYQPQVLSQQTLHKVDASQVNTYSDGYEYQKPVVKFQEIPTAVQYSTPAPVVSTYRPQSYSSQTIHKVESNLVPVSSTVLPKVELKYQQPTVSVYENPILKYTQKVTPITYVKPTPTVLTQTVVPVVQQHQVTHVSQPVQYEAVQQNYNTGNIQLTQGYSYDQPEIQRNVETLNAAKYSDASVVSQQYYHQYNTNTKSNAEKDVVFVSTTPASLVYEDHYVEAPKKVAYKAPEYVPPKTDYQASYAVVSSTPAPAIQQEAFAQYDYQSNDYSQYEVAQKSSQEQSIYFNTAHVEQPKRIESVHLSTFPGRTITTKYKQVAQAPEIQQSYQAEEYLPPVVSTTAVPVVTTTYRPRTSTSREYLPPSTSREYLPPTPEPKNDYLPPAENTYLPPTSTARTVYKSTTPKVKYVESTTFKAPEYLPPDNEPSVVHFESFGLRNFDNKEAQIKYNPYQEYTVSTAAPAVVSTNAPIYRKQNLVVETAKANLLGFGTVGLDAGLVSPATYTTASPVVVSSTQYSVPAPTVSTTYAPIIEEVSTPVPIRRSKPKVAVVTKINDFNPLLVRKLGAVCSCQSPIVVLKGRRPNVQVQQDFDDYSNDYDNSRGDVQYEQYVQKPARIRVPAVKTVTVAPVTSTFNPIIVPEDSYYQDYEDSNINIAVTPKIKEVYSENFVSSTPAVVSSTEKIVRIRPRVKAVTVAPTYQTVLLNEQVTPVGGEVEVSTIRSQAFDRYGPGGWRSKDETLQGSVDCQRAGLFRHPKQCNKFYACRWDCTKQRFTLHVFNCPVQLSFDPNIGACNWPSQGPACQGDTLLTNTL